MRASGGWHAVHQALAAEAAAAVSHGAYLARRHGHAKVTPLHVASAMLSAAAGDDLLRAACLRARSRPLQCEALERCITAALDRLPAAAAAAGVLNRGAVNAPAVSNALAAAVRRARTRLQRRRGAMGQFDVKVGFEQLVVSILDDPGVGRAMNEAGLSTYQVKADVENAVSINLPGTVAVGSKNSTGNNMKKLTESTAKADDDDGMRVLNPRVRRKQLMLTDGESVEKMVMKKVGKADLQNQHVPTNVAPSSLLHCSTEGQTSQGRPRTRFPMGGSAATEGSKALEKATTSEKAFRRRPKFTELTAENLKILCNALAKGGAQRHKDVVPNIAITVLQCRSGVARRRGKKPSSSATSLLFLGRDSGSKKAVAQELAKLVFGSFGHANGAPSSSVVELTVKRERSPYRNELGFLERLHGVIRENPRRVVMIHSVEDLGCPSKISITNAIAEGRMKGCDGGADACLEDAIVVLSYEGVDSKVGAWMNRKFSSHSSMGNEEDGLEGEATKVPCFSLDLNAYPEDTGAEELGSSPADVGLLNVVDGVFFFPLIK